MKTKRAFTRFDLILIAVLLAAGVGFFLYQRGRSAGMRVRIWADNELLETFPLNTDRVYTVTNELGTNTVVIENGAVYVTDADCPDKICEEMGAISRVGESIICLPHKLVVEVSDEP